MMIAKIFAQSLSLAIKEQTQQNTQFKIKVCGVNVVCPIQTNPVFEQT
jgi:hypothetical protein